MDSSIKDIINYKEKYFSIIKEKGIQDDKILLFDLSVPNDSDITDEHIVSILSNKNFFSYSIDSYNKLASYIFQDVRDKDWTSIRKHNGKKVDYRLGLIVECSEAIDSLDWKHWKIQENQWNNLLTELTDIYHFILAILLSKDEIKELVPQYLTINMLNSIDRVIYYQDNRDMINTIIKFLKKIIKITINKEDKKLLDIPVELFKLYRDIIVNTSKNINPKEAENMIISDYIGKVNLNIVRQELGYNGIIPNILEIVDTYNIIEDSVKDALDKYKEQENVKYIKIIDNKEDNYYLKKILEKYKDIYITNEEVIKDIFIAIYIKNWININKK